MGKISYVLRCLITLVEKEDKLRPVREGEVVRGRCEEEDETEEIELGCATIAAHLQHNCSRLAWQVLPLGHCHECRGASVH